MDRIIGQKIKDLRTNRNLTLNVIERIYATYMPSPFLSIVVSNCIQKGKDYNNGGARYNTSYIQGVGLGSITDSMAALKYHIFDEKTFTMPELLTALKDDFKKGEKIQQILINKPPKYGNDDDYADKHYDNNF